MAKHVLLICVITIVSSQYVVGQNLSPRGQFHADSIEIGSVVPYVLSLKYPEGVNVLFPDSSYTFAPFEFNRKIFFPTRTEKGISYDSAVYFLSSFELEEVQRLSLPIFVVHASDCTIVYTEEDSVFLKSYVQQVPNSIPTEQLSLKTDTAYQAVKIQLNYSLILIILGAVIVVFIGIWMVFGKRIRQYFSIRKFNKKHAKFVRHFDVLKQELMQHYSSDKVEVGLLTWKKYMESLLQEPFTKYTSKEIFEWSQDDELNSTLQQIDKKIYSGESYTAIEETLFLQLQSFAENHFQQKIMKIKNG